MDAKEAKYMLFQAKEIKDTLRLTGNIYKARTEETAYSRGFVRSEKYIQELIEKLESLTEAAPKEEEKCIDIDFNRNLLTRVKIKNNRLEFIDAINGFGNPIDVSRIKFRKV